MHTEGVFWYDNRDGLEDMIPEIVGHKGLRRWMVQNIVYYMEQQSGIGN